jgi:hypothetical protein
MAGAGTGSSLEKVNGRGVTFFSLPGVSFSTPVSYAWPLASPTSCGATASLHHSPPSESASPSGSCERSEKGGDHTARPPSAWTQPTSRETATHQGCPPGVCVCVGGGGGGLVAECEARARGQCGKRAELLADFAARPPASSSVPPVPQSLRHVHVLCAMRWALCLQCLRLCGAASCNPSKSQVASSRWGVCGLCVQRISPQFPGVLVGPPHVRKCHQMSSKEHI